MRVTILGCGSSAGVPEIGCQCNVCTSNVPENQRTRVSVFIEEHDTHLLIDSAPELRAQALRNRINRVDAVLYTHDHADHTSGLDDLRGFNKLSGDVLPIYGDQKTMESLQKRFGYAFTPKNAIWYSPALIANTLPSQAVYDFTVGNATITAFEQMHGKVNTLGYRVGNFAYSTDCNGLPESAFEALNGVDTWVVDCLRYTESYTHSNLKLTLSWIERVKPKLAVLTHMAHDFDYHALSAELPAGIIAGYDGMVLELT
jgi:phosphoribosyl 1,2-cyclic phosphate phosphodiesterase